MEVLRNFGRHSIWSCTYQLLSLLQPSLRKDYLVPCLPHHVVLVLPLSHYWTGSQECRRACAQSEIIPCNQSLDLPFFYLLSYLFLFI